MIFKFKTTFLAFNICRWGRCVFGLLDLFYFYFFWGSIMCEIYILWFLDSGKYVVFNGILQLIIYTKEKNAILFTYPPEVSIDFDCFEVDMCCIALGATLPSGFDFKIKTLMLGLKVV